jgi:hypothetical protein
MSIEPVNGVAQLVFHLYARSLHPEIFNTGEERQIWRDDYRAVFRLADAGHVVTFQSHHRTLTEAVVSRGQELPVQRRIASFSFDHNPQKSFRYDDAVRYDARFDLRSVEPDEAEREIRRAIVRNGFMCRVPVPGWPDDALQAVSYVTAAGVLSVRTYRTFPAESVMLVTHSRWEVRY